MRQAPAGGVWALAADDQSGSALRQQAEQLPALLRPTVLVGSPERLGQIMALRDEDDVRFDAILGRNALTRLREQGSLLASLRAWLLPDGRLCLAQTEPGEGQRLYALVDWKEADSDLRAAVAAAE